MSNRKKYLQKYHKIYSQTKKAKNRRKEINHSDIGRWRQFIRAIKFDYRISEFEYLSLLWKSKGKCFNKGCQTLGINQPRGLYIDHDHLTGRVRGLLCHQCNIALGHLKNDPDRIVGLELYLKLYSTRVFLV